MVEEQQNRSGRIGLIDRGRTDISFSSLPSCVSTKQLEWVTVLEQPLNRNEHFATHCQTCQTGKRAANWLRTNCANQKRSCERRLQGSEDSIRCLLPHFSLDSKQSNSKRNAQPSTHHDGPKTLHCPSHSLYSRRRFVDIVHRRPATSRCVEETISRDHHRRRR